MTVKVLHVKTDLRPKALLPDVTRSALYGTLYETLLNVDLA